VGEGRGAIPGPWSAPRAPRRRSEGGHSRLGASRRRGRPGDGRGADRPGAGGAGGSGGARTSLLARAPPPLPVEDVSRRRSRHPADVFEELGFERDRKIAKWEVGDAGADPALTNCQASERLLAQLSSAGSPRARWPVTSVARRSRTGQASRPCDEPCFEGFVLATGTGCYRLALAPQPWLLQDLPDPALRADGIGQSSEKRAGCDQPQTGDVAMTSESV